MSTRDIDKDNEQIHESRGFVVYDTEEVNDYKCEDCGRYSHCEC